MIAVRGSRLSFATGFAHLAVKSNRTQIQRRFASQSLPDLRQVENETFHRTLARDLGNAAHLLDLAALAINVHALIISIDQPSEFDTVVHPLPHLPLRRAQPVAGRHDLNDEFGNHGQEAPQLFLR